MKQKIQALVLSLAMLFTLVIPAFATDSRPESRPQTVAVDSREVQVEAYAINGHNYFRLRDVAALLNGTPAQFSVSYDADTNTATVLSGRPYEPLGNELRIWEQPAANCVPTSTTIMINGRNATAQSYLIDGSNFFRMADLAALLGFGVDDTGDTVIITSELNVEIDLAKALTSGAATMQSIHAKAGGEELQIDWYVAPYAAHPNRAEDQLINIYVPSNATETSPIIFIVNNSGWMSNGYGENWYTIPDGLDCDSVNPNPFMNFISQIFGPMLENGYVIVSYGARSRANEPTEDNEYLGHSPATVTDTKAAVRYLKYNAEALPAGDTDKIVMTGWSGGGALSTVIAASGNSPDFFESLYEIGAAGVTMATDGSYTSDATVGDDVYAVFAYCPITDLGNADAAYEFTYNETRKAMAAAGETRPESYGITDEQLFAVSDELKAAYEEYVDSLGLKDETGEVITSENLTAHVEDLMKKEIAESIQEFGIEKMTQDVVTGMSMFGPGPVQRKNEWLILHDDGTFEYDYAKHLRYVATYQDLKIAPSFSNLGLGLAEQNEDSLFGSRIDAYSPFNEYSWNHDTIKNSVGKDDTGLEWAEYIATDAGKELLQQIKMSNTVAYLNEETADIAPYWYVRYGMDDRDSSFALETILYYSMLNCEKVRTQEMSFEFAWLQQHAAYYDMEEAMDWVKNIVKPGV